MPFMRRALWLAVLASTAASAVAAAAPPTPPVTSPAAATSPTATSPAAAPAAFEHRARKPGDGVMLQLEDADLSELVRVIGEVTGKRFVIASPKLAKLKASVYAPQKVSAAEAYQAFLAVLAANGLTVVPQGGFSKIIESQDVARQLTPVERGELSPDERYVTRIHRLGHLSAEEVAQTVLSKLATKDASIVPYPAGNLLILTETSANLRRMLEILDAIDSASEEDKLWFQPLRHVASSQVEKQLAAVLGLASSHGAGADRRDAPAAPASGGGALHVGRIVALERPNALVMIATRASYQRILALLEAIDVAPTSEAEVRVVMLQHADAKKIAGPINEALGGASSAPAGVPGGGVARGSPAAAAPVLESPAKVAPDETTNSLIVTATLRDFTAIKAVIDALDRPKRQVFIEAVVLDVSADRGVDLSAAWHGGSVDQAALGPGEMTTYGGMRPLSSITPSSSELQAFALGVRGPSIPFLENVPGLSSIPSFGLFLSAVATSKAVDIVSTPNILASDNTQAEIRVQLQTSLQPNAPQTTILPTGATAVAPNVGSSVANNFRGIGPRIRVTPHLNDSDEVRIDIDELISDIASTPDKGDTYGTISYVERTATTTFTVRDGETTAIAGLVRNRLSRSETKVPVLGDIPLLGALFRSRADRTEKSNLVLVITPYIIRDQVDLKRIFERKMQERQELIDHDAVFTGGGWRPPKDWGRTHGLLTEIRATSRQIENRRAQEAARRPPEDPGIVPSAPMELPVPQGPAPAGIRASPGAPSPTPSPGALGAPATATGPSPSPVPAAPAPRPSVVER